MYNMYVVEDKRSGISNNIRLHYNTLVVSYIEQRPHRYKRIVVAVPLASVHLGPFLVSVTAKSLI